MKKALLAFSLALVLLLATACGNTAGTSGSSAPAGDAPAADAPASQPPAAEPDLIGGTMKYDVNAPVNGGEALELVVWAESETEPFYTEIAQKYMQVHPNITVTVVSQPWDDYWTKLPLALSAGNGPDLYRAHSSRFQELVSSSYPLPHDIFPRDELYADFPEAEDLETEDGELYTVPLGATFSGGIYYNKGMWAEAGLTEADIPKTWDEFIEVGQALTKKDDNGNVTQYGFSVDHAFEGFLVTLNYISGQTLFQSDGFTWNWDASATYENIQMLQDFKDKYGFMMYSDGDCEDQFGHGQAAMVSNWNWLAGYFNDVYPDVEWGYFLSPTQDGNTPPAYDLKDYEWSLGVGAVDEAKRAVAFDFIKYFLCEEETYLEVAVRLGLIPCNVNLQSDPRVNEYENLRVASAVSDRHVYLGIIPMNDMVYKSMREAGSDIFINGKDAKDVIPTTQAAIMEKYSQNAVEYKSKESEYEYYSELKQ